jgi:hypothetical protein
MTENEYTCVWVSDIPMTPDVTWADPVTFEIDLPNAVLVWHEWIEEGTNHREWLVPAAKVNIGIRRRVKWPECLYDRLSARCEFPPEVPDNGEA